jgi:hypothetical protein
MVYRIVLIVILLGCPFKLTGTKTNVDSANLPPEEVRASCFPTLQVTGTETPGATPPETQSDEQVKEEVSLTPAQIAVVEKVREALRKRDRTILIKSVAITIVGGITMIAIGRLK